MPTVRRSRVLEATPQEVWDVVEDPHHLPRWWPRVTRVEAVEGDEFTEVLRSDKGKTVRADFHVLDREQGRRVVWSQRIEDTPFARVLQSAETEIALAPVPVTDGAIPAEEIATRSTTAAATEVTVELRQRLTGVFPSRTFSVPLFGRRLVTKAAARTVEEALEGLERIFGR